MASLLPEDLPWGGRFLAGSWQDEEDRCFCDREDTQKSPGQGEVVGQSWGRQGQAMSAPLAALLSTSDSQAEGRLGGPTPDSACARGCRAEKPRLLILQLVRLSCSFARKMVCFCGFAVGQPPSLGLPVA